MLDTYSIILINEHLVTLILPAKSQNISLQLGKTTFGLTLHLLASQLLPLKALTLHLLTLLLLKVLLKTKGLHLLLLLLHLALLLETVLLKFVFALLLGNFPLLGCPVRLRRLWWRILDNGLAVGGHGWGVRSQKAWRVLRKLGNTDQAGKVLQVGALIVELNQSIVLSVVTLSQENQSLGIVSAYSMMFSASMS